MGSRRLHVLEIVHIRLGLSLRCILLFTSLSGVGYAYAQIPQTSARVSALVAGASLPDPAAHLNPATAGMTAQTLVALWIAQLYGLPELKVYGGSGASSFGRFGYSVSLHTSGFDRFSEEQLSVQLSTAIGPKKQQAPRIGTGILLVRKSAARGREELTLVLRSGLLMPLSDRFVLGARFQRAVSTNAQMPTGHYESLLMGIGYAVHEHISFYSDILLDRYFPVSYRLGFESKLVESLTIRMGHSTFPVRFTFGFSVHVKRLDVHFSFDRHSVLGWSIAAEVAFRIA